MLARTHIDDMNRIGMEPVVSFILVLISLFNLCKWSLFFLSSFQTERTKKNTHRKENKTKQNEVKRINVKGDKERKTVEEIPLILIIIVAFSLFLFRLFPSSSDECAQRYAHYDCS